jgi:O-antigen/teichoic acid export membrane protein
MADSSLAVSELSLPPGDNIPRARHPLGFSSAGVFFAGTLVQVGGFVGSVFLYKFVGVSSAGQALLGTIQLFLLIATSISSVGDLRIGSAYTFFVARGKPPIDLTGTYVVLRFVIAGGAALLILVAASVAVNGHALINTLELYEILAAVLALPILWSLPAVYTQLHVAQGDSVKAQYPSLVEIAVRTPLLLVVALYSPTLWSIALAFLAGAAVSAVYCLPSVIPQMSRYRSGEARRMFQFAWPLMGSLGLSYLAANAIPFIVDAAAGAQKFNIFNAANGFRIVALSLATAVATPLFPLISGLHQRKEYREIRVQTIHILRYGMMIVVPVALAIAIYRTDLLRVFTTAGYLPGSDALAVLAVSVIPASLTTLIFTALIAVGRQRLELYIAGIQTIVLFAVAFVLLSSRDPELNSNVLLTAAIAVLASSAVALVANLYFLSTIMSVGLPLRSVGGVAVAAGAGLTLGYVVDLPFAVDPLVHLLVGVAVGWLAFVLVLAGTGELTKSDVHLLAGSLRLPRSLAAWVSYLCWRSAPPESLYPIRDEATRLDEPGHGF